MAIIIMGIIMLPSITEGASIHGFHCMQGGSSMIPSMPINAGITGTITSGRAVYKKPFINVEKMKGEQGPTLLLH
jgi:hypothetical protein